MHKSSGDGQLVRTNRHAAVLDFSQLVAPGLCSFRSIACRGPGLGKRRMLLLLRYRHEFPVLVDQAACRQAYLRPRRIWTEATTRASLRCSTVGVVPSYDGQGLPKPDKVAHALTNVAMFKAGDNINKWMESIWTCILLHQGGAAL